MAPMTRSNALIAQADGRSRIGREPSWQFGQPDMASEREVSTEASSYNDDMQPELGDDEGEYEKQDQIEINDVNDKDLHPLREAANRVGREVERFAEVLDGYNPLRATARDEKYDMTIDLIDLYYDTALDTLARLREQHQAERRKKDGLRWRKKMRGFKITMDDEDMEVGEEDGNQFLEPQTTLDDLLRWEQEAQTWDLLRRLVQRRFPPPGSKNKNAEPRHKPNQYTTEREVWDEFLESDTLALERRTVLQWLKDTAEETGEDIDVLVHDLQQNAERGDIIAHGWIHTKAAIKNQKRLHSWPQALDPTSAEVQRVHLNSAGTELLITQLDPDAMTRQDRKLEAQDEYFERAIWLGCYEMLRRGKDPAEIREWCSERTEVWRAVSMSGLPDEKPTDEDEIGNPASNALWRRMCFSLARNGGGDEYERAVYGILSGDISSVEPVCRSWDDFVFAHYNALLRTQFDHHLQKRFTQSAISSTVSNFGSFDAVQFHGDSRTAGKRLVETLKTDPRTSDETLQPMKMLQGVLIANQFDNFIYQQGLALSELANARGTSNLIPATDERPENAEINKYVALDDHDSLRVLTHVLLVFISLGLDLGGAFRQTVTENVIVAYISFLRLAGKEELIPLYCSQLSGARRYATLSRNLIDVTDHEQRITQINLMKELGLDAQEFVKFQSRYLFADYPDETDRTGEYPAAGSFKLLEDSLDSSGRKVRRDIFGDDPEKVDRVDMLFIRSLEWYLLVDGLWSETFMVGTMLYLRFFKNMHLTAARMLAARISSSDIARNKTRAILGQSVDFEQLEYAVEDEDLTEVLDGSANEKRLMRKHLVGEAKSFRELETLIQSLENMDTIATLGYLMKEQDEPMVQKKLIRHQLASYAQAIRPLAQPLLKDWLLTSRQDEGEEFRRLREAYLPETILAYISTLQLSGESLSRDLLMECMDLSALVAAEDSDLLELFMKVGRMQELVEAFAHAGKSLLLLTSAKGSSSKSKKIRTKGWTPELWTVKP